MKRTSVLLLIGCLWLTLAGAASAPARADAPDYRFGIVAATDAPWSAAELGAGWTQLMFRWDEIQPERPDQWNVPFRDEQVALELTQGRQVVGVVVGSPAWAADPARGSGVPRGLDLPADDPANLWAGFLRALVTRYAGRIDHWVIWEHPDGPSATWGGSVADFAQLLRVSYAVIHQANPDSVVHLPGVTHWDDVNNGQEPFLRRLLQTLSGDPEARANGYYFDVATLRIYNQPESLYDLTVYYRTLLASYGLAQPIWIAETNVVPADDPAWPLPNNPAAATLQEQAAFIIQALALGIAGGAERIAVYRLVDNPQDGGPCGLLRADATPRPAFTAYRTAVTYLAGFRSARWERRDGSSIVVVERGGQVTTVVWARTAAAQTVVLTAQTTQALLVDIEGRARIIYPERGYYILTLAGCPHEQPCAIGGAPLMLVETHVAGTAVPTLPPAPTVPPVTAPLLPTPTPAPTRTPLPTAAPLSVVTPTLLPNPSPTALTPSPSPTALTSSSLPTALTSSSLPTALTTSPSPAPRASVTPAAIEGPVNRLPHLPITRVPISALSLLLASLAVIGLISRKHK